MLLFPPRSTLLPRVCAYWFFATAVISTDMSKKLKDRLRDPA